jgi:CDP-glucose 4,6-dehydratase
VEWIVAWHKAHLDGRKMHDVTEAQIASFEMMMDTK